MTNEALIRLDQRVIVLEGIITGLLARVNTLEGRIETSISKLEALNNFYGDATNRLFTVLDKVAAGDTTRIP